MTRDKLNKTQSTYPLFIVISGPSGVGKDAALDNMKKAGFPFHYVLTATTRLKRPAEKDGVAYRFLSEDKFRQMIGANQFLEWAKVYGNYYGVPKQEVKNALKQGLDTIVKVDIQGATTIKSILADAVLIFLMPPSMDELVNRLKQRYGLSSEELDLRLSKAQEEIESLSIFDYVVVNHTDDLNLTVDQINAIVVAEKCRLKPRVVTL
ncbi:MAG: guanylate kinase [Chloroflexota bacterium]|nr:MAG: guanylate kinase [Chloroflexota bacterium]